MHIRTQLLASFLGVTLLALAIYGAVAYRIAPDVSQRLESRRLTQLAGDLALQIEQQAPGDAQDSAGLIRILRTRRLAPRMVMALDTPSRVTLISPETRESQPLVTAIARSASRQGGDGKIILDNQDYLWSSYPLRNTPYSIILALPPSDDANQIGHIITSRLMATALIVIWLAVWVALILASVIARRLDEKNAVLTYQALHDNLTGLPNRALLYDRLRDLTRTSHKNQNQFSLLVMDLDRFKEVNDTLGHHFGDQILIQVGRRVRAQLRDFDVIARLGGDEFAVLVPDADAAQGLACAKRLLHCFDDPFSIDGITLVIKPNTGVASFPEHGQDADTLIRHADVAMYHAKRKTCGYELYQPLVDSHSVRRLTLMSELRHAIDEGQLVLNYQPKVDLAARRLLGVEALLRWNHPHHGFVTPDEFIPLAEQSGLIHPLTDWVLNEALRQCSDWCAQGLTLGIAINISTHSLSGEALPEKLAELLRKWQLPPHNVELEITESAMMSNIEQAESTLHSLDAMGVRLSIDDFGTGFSSMAYLQRLPFDTLKIDKSFVINMERDENNAAIVRAIIDLAHSLELEVIAEGVENAISLRALTQLGCNTAQGNHIAHPMSAEKLTEWLADAPWENPRSVVPLKQGKLRSVAQHQS
jgi:diguanylate cyclase